MTDKELVSRIGDEDINEDGKLTDEEIVKVRELEAAIASINSLDDEGQIHLVRWYLKRMDEEELGIKKGFLDWVEPYYDKLSDECCFNCAKDVPIEKKYTYEVLYLTMRQLNRELFLEYRRREIVGELREKGKIAKYYNNHDYRAVRNLLF